MSTIADSSPSEQGYSPPTYAIVLVVLVFVIGLSAVFSYRYSRNQDIRGVVQSRFPIFTTTQPRGLGLQAIQRIPIVRYRKQASQADEAPSETQHPPFTLGNNTVNLLSDRWQIASTRDNHRLISIGSKSQKPSLVDVRPSCCICTEEIVEGVKIRILPCGHIFHPPCIDPWLIDQASTCPLWYAALTSQ
ncbi:hypothetical protein BGZ63DRAFT_387628 [Mariannaea sp. PMI_226]|nr:hypothetical protein BGZ63DRAFT_387628 [Mariannaea sp. PMI_226]